jgi:adenine-specific DNA-methyltransferase
MTDKKIISSCIKKFSNGSLSANALALFSALGYQSSLTFNVPTSIEKVFDFESEKALQHQWLDAPFLFQLTESNLRNIQSLFTQVDGTIIESYMFVAIELNQPHYTRSELVTITRELNKKSPQPILILFKYGERKTPLLTLSVIHRRLHKRDESKDVLEKVTLLKDIRTKDPHRAHIDILSDLAFDNLNLKAGASFVDLHNAWQKVLDTKTLNKQFYKELSQWYFWAMKEENVYFPNAKEIEADKTSVFNNDDKSRKHDAESLIRLLTRLLFVWFIKEKNLIPEQLFDENWIKSQLEGFKPKINDKPNATFQGNDSHYYRAILQNLFFATLNQICEKRGFIKNEIEHKDVTNLMRYQSYFKDPESFLILMKEVVPFMNGGLFDCLDKVIPNLKNKQGGNVVAYEDSFLDRPDNQLKVPDYIFFGTHKNIDLSEDLGNKHKSVEIKGLIDILKSYKFTITENTPIEEDIALDPELLGQVFENLLASYNPETQTTARKQTGSFYTPREIVDYMVDESLKVYLKSKLNHLKNEQLDDLLSYTKPAPEFSEIEKTALIEAIDTCKILDPACGSGAFPMGILHKLVFILGKIDPNNELWKQRQIKEKDSDLQKRIIETFSDNEVDYTRKLYLIENCIYGVDIQAIAIQISKLRFFISLMVDQKVDRNKTNFGVLPLPNLETKFVAANTLIGIEKPKAKISLFDNKEIKVLEEKLKKVRHSLFFARTKETKEKYRSKDKSLREQIGILLEQHAWGNETAQQLAHWNPYDQNTSTDFFDAEWMFGENGFDIVIGNPPYGVSIKNEYRTKVVTHLGKVPDYEIYYYFIEIARVLLKEGGVNSYIIPNTFLFNVFAKNYREKLVKEWTIRCLIDCTAFKIFDAATVLNAITVFIKDENENNKIGYKFTAGALDFSELSSRKTMFLSKEDVLENNKNWGLLFKLGNSVLHIISKIKKSSITLSDLFPEYSQGLIAYDKYQDQSEETIKNRSYHYDKNENNNLKKFLWGEDVTKYHVNWNGKEWIDYCDGIANPRQPKFFKGKRILIREITNPSIFAAYTDEELYHDPSIIVVLDNHCGSVKVLLAILNSRLASFYHFNSSPKATKGAFPKILVTDIKNFPIPKILETNQKLLIKLVDYIFFIKKQPFYNSTDLDFAEERLMSNFFENLIDALVYELYFPEELHEANKHFMSLVAQENLPDLDTIESDKVDTLKQIVRRLTDKNHPLYNNLFFLDSVPVIRVIEGKA